MGHFVVVEIAWRCEFLAASRAFVWLFSTVNPFVRVETGWRRKSLRTDWTGVRSLARVRPEVTIEQRRAVEGFTAKIARQQAFPPPGFVDLRVLFCQGDAAVAGHGFASVVVWFELSYQRWRVVDRELCRFVEKMNDIEFFGAFLCIPCKKIDKSSKWLNGWWFPGHSG